MGKKRRILVAAMLLAVLGGYAWLVLRPREPVYEGKAVGYWLAHPRTHALTNLPNIPGFTTSHMLAIEFPKMDSNAVPYLIQALEWKDGPLQKAYSAAWSKAPSGIRRRLPEPVPAGTIRANAATVLCKLGADAKPAIPALARAMISDSEATVRFRAATTLLAIGKGENLIVPWTVASNDSSPGVRLLARSALRPVDPDTGAPVTDHAWIVLPDPGLSNTRR